MIHERPSFVKKKSPIVKFYLVNAKLSIFFRGVADSNA